MSLVMGEVWEKADERHHEKSQEKYTQAHPQYTPTQPFRADSNPEPQALAHPARRKAQTPREAV